MKVHKFDERQTYRFQESQLTEPIWVDKIKTTLRYSEVN